MHSDRESKMVALFEAAQAVGVEKRADFLSKECADDIELRAEVESLLQQDAGSFLESSSPLSGISAGMKLGVYELRHCIGRGGMGEVWGGFDPRLKRDVAVKILPLVFASDPARVARFEREARAASALNHPNIVAVHDIGRSEGVYWIVSELVEGETLANLLKRGPLPLKRLVDIGVQIADGLTAAHTEGVVHRDLKPANLMITHTGRVKILDFGLAKQTRAPNDAAHTAASTESGVVMGTPGYMSPEQVRGEAVDARSDLFSLGAILYEMRVGKPAFRGDSSIEVMNSILKDDLPELPPISPPALDRIIRHCLEKQPAMRFQAAADLGFALASISPSQATHAPARKRALWPLWTAVTMACLAACGAAWWLGARAVHSSGLPEASLRRLTNVGGLAIDPAISPDGKLVAYASDRANSNNLDIWVQQVDGGGASRLTDDPADDYSPAFSPDGTQIAFRSDRSGGGIYVIPALGGEARLLIPQGRQPRFSPDGQALMYSVGYARRPDSLYVQRSAGVAPFAAFVAAPVRIGAGCQVRTDTAVWSPDSRRVLFGAFCGNSGPGGWGLWLSSLDGKRTPGPRPLDQNILSYIDISQWLPNPSRLLIPLRHSDREFISILPISEDGTKVAGPWQTITFGTGSEAQASAASTGRMTLASRKVEVHIWGIPIDGNGQATGAPKRLTSRPAEEQETGFTLSRNGANLDFEADGDLYYRNLSTGKEQPISAPGATGNGLSASFSPDARTVMFVGQLSSDWTKGTSLYEMPILGGTPKRIWDAPGSWLGVWDWAPDGTTLLFWPWRTENGNGRILELDLKSLLTTRFLDDPHYQEWQAHFSGDGRWVTFDAVKDGHSEVYIAPFRKALVPRSEWIPVTGDSGGDTPRFSHDGKLVFFSSDRDGFLCIWAQRLRPDMHPLSSPFAVYHFHERRHSLSNLGANFELAVGPKMIVFKQAEISGKIWLLDPGKQAAP